MTPEIITAVISAGTTLLISIGTWHVSMKQYREKNLKMVDNAIDSIKDSVTAYNADIQQHLAIIDLEIKTLSERVDKHNQVIDRTNLLEKNVALNASEIEHLKERLG